VLSLSICAEFLLRGLYILKSPRLPSLSHLCLQELQHLFTCIFLFYCHRLWCLVCFEGIIIIIIIIISRHTAFNTSVHWFCTVIIFRSAVPVLSLWISLSVGPYLKVAKPARPGDKGYTSRPYGVSRTNLLSSSSLAACWPPGCWYMTLRGRGSQGTMSVITRCMQLINNGGAKSQKVNVYCFYMLFVCGFKISLHCILIIVQTSVSSRDVAWLIHNKSVLQRNYILIFVLASFFLSFSPSWKWII